VNYLLPAFLVDIYTNIWTEPRKISDVLIIFRLSLWSLRVDINCKILSVPRIFGWFYKNSLCFLKKSIHLFLTAHLGLTIKIEASSLFPWNGYTLVMKIKGDLCWNKDRWQSLLELAWTKATRLPVILRCLVVLTHVGNVGCPCHLIAGTRIFVDFANVPFCDNKGGSSSTPESEESTWGMARGKVSSNAKARDHIHHALASPKFMRISSCATAKETWDRLEVTH